MVCLIPKHCSSWCLSLSFLLSSSAHWWAVRLNEMSNCFSLGSKMFFAILPCAFRGLLHLNFILGPLDLSMFPFLEWDLTPNPSELCPHTLLGEDPLLHWAAMLCLLLCLFVLRLGFSKQPQTFWNSLCTPGWP